MESEQQLLNDLEEFKKEFPTYPNPEVYPIQFEYFVKLFYFYKKRRENNGRNLVNSFQNLG